MTKRAIVLDANILVRAVLGQRVRTLILDHAGDVSFFAPDTAFDEAREHLPALLEKRGVTAGPALDFLTALEKVVRSTVGPLLEHPFHGVAGWPSAIAHDWSLGCGAWR